MVRVLLGCGAVCFIGMLLQMFWLGRQRGDPRAPIPSPEQVRARILWRSFYVNPDDARGWLPKPCGVGQTVNFRSRRNALLFTALMVAGALSVLLAALVGLLGP
jgi:uncharacterized membrane protein